MRRVPLFTMVAKGRRYEATCPKNLWSVSGPDMNTVIAEAMHYWQQYDRDGEYDELYKLVDAPKTATISGASEEKPSPGN